MTEDEWITATDPQEMLRACGTPSDRKLRLFSAACCRRMWHSLTDKGSRVGSQWPNGMPTASRR